MRLLLAASAALLLLSAPGFALAGEGCSHAKEATTAAAETVPADVASADECTGGCTHACDADCAHGEGACACAEHGATAATGAAPDLAPTLAGGDDTASALATTD